MEGMHSVIKEEHDGIGWITLNNPEGRNSLSGVLIDELKVVLDEFGDNSNIRVVVIRGAGSVFSAGGNVKTMLERIETGTANYAVGIRKLGAIFMQIRNMRKPVIASIHGAAAGGGLNLAMGCDFRIAAEDTKFVFAFVNIGLIPDVGGPVPLIWALGVPKATELLMTGRLFTAHEAYDWGLMNEIVPLDQLEEATLKLARRLAHGPTISYGCIKAMINRAAFSGMELELDNEVEYQVMCSRTADHKEGVTAFVEKRKPDFKGF